MDNELAVNLHKIVPEICDKLLTNHKLITSKNVISSLLLLDPRFPIELVEQDIINNINSWRVTRLNSIDVPDLILQSMEQDPKLVEKSQFKLNYNKLLQDNLKYKQKLAKANQEIYFLNHKITALNAFYEQQRKELINRIEEILCYKSKVN